MPNLIRLAQRGKGERRASPRYLVPAEEPVAVAVVVAGPEGRTLTLTGTVRDVSETGLSILLPGGETCRELTKPGRALAAVVSLPSGVIRLRAEVAHGSAWRGGYLVGVCISEIGSGDHGRLSEYIGGRG